MVTPVFQWVQSLKQSLALDILNVDVSALRLLFLVQWEHPATQKPFHCFFNFLYIITVIFITDHWLV